MRTSIAGLVAGCRRAGVCRPGDRPRRSSPSGGSRASTRPRTTRCSRPSRSSRPSTERQGRAVAVPGAGHDPEDRGGARRRQPARRRLRRRLRLPGHRQVGLRRQARGRHRASSTRCRPSFAPNTLETTFLYNDKTKKRAYYAFPIKQQTMHIEYWNDMLAEAGFKESRHPDRLEGLLELLVRQGAAGLPAEDRQRATSASACRWASTRATRSTRS